MRDLIEAGLSEPAEALATYGISAAPLVAGGQTRMIQFYHAGEGDAILAAQVEVTDVPTSNLRKLLGGNAVR
ncbi:hypothetical protein [Blastomonas sp.]|uniref:hypothetical protein n=1 Tax=Blastomonas sp. TaxID=1909299 RepID=UPI003593D8E9